MKRTDSVNFAEEYRGFSNEDRQQKEVKSDEVYLEGVPTNYGYKDMKKDLFA